ncbi:Hypothetical protein R9X50_00502400 [Acrodontium crateriforme]|uniref:Homeobox domain-containing protein n=1 Tax=Acrodontium crateriforme TaxID=150365 RepID=A0AAQ3M6C8_9PEZI|nr:Hypothetical protein R9X50_00502400 [Acrodontium crateriforme]
MSRERSTTLLLSPPNSPRMSGEHKKSEYQWQQAPTSSYNDNHSQFVTGATGLLAAVPKHLDNGYGQSMLSEHGLPYTLDLPTSSAPKQICGISSVRHDANADGIVNSTGRLTPNSAATGLEEVQPENRERKSSVSEQDEDDDDEQDTSQMTAAERRAAKRKMKRFRLTHNQTRFLMNEFARKPHPDASHREKLSREIPGLSPRQVQVWFQNRRAKLKRLKTDDGDRLTRTRGLPSEFESKLASQSWPFPTQESSASSRVTSTGYGPVGESGDVRSLSIDTFRRRSEIDYGSIYSGSSGISPAMGASAFSPSRSSADAFSPISTGGNTPLFGLQPQDSPRHWSIPIQGNYGTHGSSINDRLSRSLGDSTGSSLRASNSYGGLGPLGGTPPAPSHRSYSDHGSVILESPQRQRSRTAQNIPYDVGITYGQQSMSHAPMEQYRRASSHLAGPPMSNYAQFQPAQYSTTSSSAYSTPTFQSAFDYTGSERNQVSFGGMPNTFGSSENQDRTGEGENQTQVGVAMPSSY